MLLFKPVNQCYNHIMPTPFTHLKTAQVMLTEPALSEPSRAFVRANLSAYLLGHIAADARVSSGLTRESTHFYDYRFPMEDHPWRVMLNRNPSLWKSQDEQRAFVAGYVAHLCMDEIWALHMLAEQFAQREWADSRQKFLMLHVLLIYMDERDEAGIEDWQYPALSSAHPKGWVPFMDDTVLSDWRDTIALQLRPDGVSLTVPLLAERLALPPQHLRLILDNPQRMADELWANIPPETLADVEARMYIHAVREMQTYLDATG